VEAQAATADSTCLVSPRTTRVASRWVRRSMSSTQNVGPDVARYTERIACASSSWMSVTRVAGLPPVQHAWALLAVADCAGFSLCVRITRFVLNARR
jgi:hypothetical protein